MSGNDNTNWDDHLDFESLADEHDSELGVSESGEGSSDLTDLSYDSEPVDGPVDSGDPVSGQDPRVDPGQSSKSAAKSTKARYQGRSGLPAVVMGFLFGFSAVVSGLGIGGAVLLLSGLELKSLWNPTALLSLGPWLDLANNPLNVLYLVGAGILLLSFLISWRVFNFSRGANRNLRDTEELLGKLIALRFDNESSWQNPIFKLDQAVESFVSEILGAWRLQAARQDKNLALEGELRRLEQAVTSSSRDQLTGSFEHPTVGRLGDQYAHWYDEKEAAKQEVEAVRAKDQHESLSLIGVIQDARSWNRHTLDKLGIQGAALERLARNLSQVAEDSGSADQVSSRTAQISVTLRELRTELANLAMPKAGAGEAKSSDVVGIFTDLVDRVGKLAFQIAMEVASLGSRGERLLPMAQSLEELTTEFRESSGLIVGSNSSSDSDEQKTMQDLTRKVEGLVGILDSVPAEANSSLKTRTSDLSQVGGAVSAELVNIAGSFNHQAERLTNLGTSFASLTGAPFDAGDLAIGKPDNPPDGTLELSQMDPFANEAEVPAPMADIDPFSTAEPVLPEMNDQERDPDFSTDVAPGMDSLDLPSNEEPVLEPESRPGLSMDDDRVYDLSEFDAVPVEDLPSGTEDQDRIYDLAEFGAVGVD